MTMLLDENDGTVAGELDDVDTRPVIAARQILVVDDTPANLVAFEAALAPLDRRVVYATSGREALAKLFEQDFALILLDVQMPEMDGYETAQLIRCRERSKHVPIIFVTAHTHDPDSVMRAYQMGAVDFLAKPLLPEVLRAKASVFVTLQERTEQLAAERIERDFENRRRDYEATALRRERDREHAAKQELERLNEALAASDRRKDSFMAILGHELRNPLAPIRTCIDLMRGAEGQPVTPRILDVLDRQTGMLSRLVDDLLDLSRIKADKIELRPEIADLADVLETALATSRPVVEERGHTFATSPPGTPVRLVADTVRIAQVVSNLMNNAARYTPRGGRIELAWGLDGDEVFIRVSDTGIGIPAELQQTIFQMFVQERVSSDGSGGLGLGLALARRLVELHRGRIAVRSDGRGCGSTFEIRLPSAMSPQALSPRRRTRDLEALPRALKLGAIRTVVVDDNDDARELLTDLLRARGFEVLSACDGPAGFELIRAQEPDVALVDLGLPGLDGVGVVEQLRAAHPSLKTRLVALTGYGDRSDHERTQRAGFHGHLVKPASADAIFELLERVLEGPR